ncbi:MAG: NAD(P)-dependent oxidoreductase [Oscillospiraceae bacterium]|jgi:nucleoside-diphosphate-sugar epimerase|nr:NAD(P)-dependent oxidoreductase [Oscillospiraceae bacterium]
MAKKTVFLTGSSGNMGWQGFQEIYQRRDKFNLVLLNRGSAKNREKFAAYENDPSVKLLWGDLLNYDDVLAGIAGADVVLHVGGMVSPAADYDPKGTIKTNTSAAKNIVRAVQAQPNADDIKVVYIGTVAETGERDAPIHWGRCGDPIKISVYDHYAISKVIAERIFAESGLKHWVSLRQSGILYANIIKNYDPIMFHVPMNGVLEWATVEDSGRLLANVCEDWVPEEFWRGFYNIGSGADYRITNYEFESYLLGALGLGSPEKLFSINWHTLRNFHGQWYADSDLLEHYLRFRENKPIKKYFEDVAADLPWFYKLAKIAPKGLVKTLGMKRLTTMPVYGTMTWLKEQNDHRINAYFGSREAWEKIGTWKTFDRWQPTLEERTSDKAPAFALDHGYDESKPLAQLTVEDLQKAAAYRGGALVSSSYSGDPYAPLTWKSAGGREFEMTPNLVLRGGHWCPQEVPGPDNGDWANPFIPWDYDEEAKRNPFFAQVWYPLHDKSEQNVYGEEIFAGMKGY